MLDNNAELGWASPSSCQYEKANTTPRFQKGLQAVPESESPVLPLLMFLTPDWGEEECGTARSFNSWPWAQQDE